MTLHSQSTAMNALAPRKYSQRFNYHQTEDSSYREQSDVSHRFPLNEFSLDGLVNRLLKERRQGVGTTKHFE